jgi:hypothetical protein
LDGLHPAKHKRTTTNPLDPSDPVDTDTEDKTFTGPATEVSDDDLGSDSNDVELMEIGNDEV